MKRTIANSTGFHRCFSAPYSEETASVEIRITEMKKFLGRMWLSANPFLMAQKFGVVLVSYFTEGFVEEANAFVDVGFGDVQHRR